eukprot:Platyproteum_vivax@DN7447_c0_g2_i1.p1
MVITKHYDEWIKNPDNLCDLTGKRALVTGVSATNALGFWTTYGLMAKGCECFITARAPPKAEEVKKALEAKCVDDGYQCKPVRILKMDNCSFKSVNEACEQVKKEVDSLDIIITNAGIMMGDYDKTEDGWEKQIQTNHLSHFLMIRNLFPLVKKAAEQATDGFKPTITQVSSIMSYMASVKVHPDDLNIECPDQKSGLMKWLNSLFVRDIKASMRYCQSKFANVLCAQELADRLEAAGLGDKIISDISHPGASRTNLIKDNNMGSFGDWIVDSRGQSAADGSLPSLMAAAGPTRKSKGFYGPKSEMSGVPTLAKCTNAHVNDLEMSKRLWEESEKIVGKFDFATK